MMMRITVNGEAQEVEAPENATLLDLLRERLELTGAKLGCNMGECGACTVLVDGLSVNSCLMLAAEADGSTITTVEGLADGDRLHPIQSAFAKHGGAQCGYCTPGMIMASKALLAENPNPTEAEIRFGLAGNICRCTGYAKIVEAVTAAAANLRGEEKGDV